MRRLVRNFLAWWNRPVVVEYEPLTPEQQRREDEDVLAESEAWRTIAEAEYAPPSCTLEPTLAPLVDWSGFDIHAAADAIVAAHIPALPRRIEQKARQTAREIRADFTSVVFTADDLPLPDDPYTADVNWILAVYNLLTERRDALPLPQRVALHRAVQTPRRARLTLTIYLPYGVGELAKRTVIQSLRNEVQSVLGPHVLWGDVDARCFPSNNPSWAVSIAAVDAPMQVVA